MQIQIRLLHGKRHCPLAGPLTSFRFAVACSRNKKCQATWVTRTPYQAPLFYFDDFYGRARFWSMHFWNELGQVFWCYERFFLEKEQAQHLGDCALIAIAAVKQDFSV
jgi:hypothetical protein